ncbi:glycosyltransferase family 2 protein [Paenibacillus sp. strain BS8-2]
MDLKVSVIVPVYNTEKYLSECIESLLAQTLDSCEFLFINDGSRDGSLAILERYRMKDSRIRVINQENQGVSAARNAGIAAARGEYIGFVDSDDWVEADMFEVMYQAAKASDCDIVLIDYVTQLEGQSLRTHFEITSGTRLDRAYVEREVMPIYMKGWSMNSVCNKLFRAELIVGNEIFFQKGRVLGEDKLFGMELLAASNSMFYEKYAGYHYREVQGSATRNLSKMDYFGHAIEVYEENYPQVYARLMGPAQLNQLKSIELIQAIMSYIHVYFIPGNGLAIREQLSAVKDILRHTSVQSALRMYINLNVDVGKYELWMLRLMNRRSALGLYGLTAYSRFRNHTRNEG